VAVFNAPIGTVKYKEPGGIARLNRGLSDQPCREVIIEFASSQNLLSVLVASAIAPTTHNTATAETRLRVRLAKAMIEEALVNGMPRSYKLIVNIVVMGETACTAKRRKKPRKPKTLPTFLRLIANISVRIPPNR